jgi:hypothetical protein
MGTSMYDHAATATSYLAVPRHNQPIQIIVSISFRLPIIQPTLKDMAPLPCLHVAGAIELQRSCSSWAPGALLPQLACKRAPVIIWPSQTGMKQHRKAAIRAATVAGGSNTTLSVQCSWQGVPGSMRPALQHRHLRCAKR